MRVKPETVLPPPSADCLAYLERAYRVRFPPSFRWLLTFANGATPIDNVFDADGRERLVERFLCVLDSPRDHEDAGVYDIAVVETQVSDRMYDDEDLEGASMLPFAVLFGGDLVCLDYRRTRTDPPVVVWDHEQSDEGKPVVVRVADDVAAFVDLLREAHDGDRGW